MEKQTMKNDTFTMIASKSWIILNEPPFVPSKPSQKHLPACCADEPTIWKLIPKPNVWPLAVSSSSIVPSNYVDIMWSGFPIAKAPQKSVDYGSMSFPQRASINLVLSQLPILKSLLPWSPYCASSAAGYLMYNEVQVLIFSENTYFAENPINDQINVFRDT